jgi:hypothetical protein
MWDCEADLWEMARGIEPTAAQKSAASRSHNYMRDLLLTGQFGNRVKDTYLSGSYARDTAVSPIDDVDIIVVVDPNGWLRSLLDCRPEPARVLQSFAGAIRYRYPESSVYVQRRSVRLELYHLDIDVVPAVEGTGGPHRIEIPDVDTDEWITSAPKVHMQIATDINSARGGRFKPLVKLLKYWNSRLPDTAYLKSFAIETLAATLFRNVNLPTLQEGLRLFFDFLASCDNQAALYRWGHNFGVQMNWWTHELPDLAGTGSNLLARVDRNRRVRLLEHAIRARDGLMRADKARTRDSAVRHVDAALRMIEWRGRL